MANDDALIAHLSRLSTQDSSIQVQRLSATSAKSELGLPVGRSSNPVYRFQVESAGTAFEAVAFTSILNGRGRPATRAEALGQAIAENGVELFKRNPFFLVFDYADGRFIAASAAKLFGAFAKEAERREIPYSESAAFSLTPGFDRKTLTMYANLSGDDIWWCQDINALSAQDLREGLERIRIESQGANIEEIIRATIKRIQAAPSPVLISEKPLGQPAFLPLGNSTGERGEIELDPRVWRMIVTAISSSPAVILVGPPGTGKTALVQKAIGYFSEQYAAAGSAMKPPLWATPDESWTTRDLVGGDTISDGEIVFRPGWVPRSLEENRWLILDEANRADMDRIFGGLLTWLSGGRVAIGTENSGSSAREVQLGWVPETSGKFETDEGAILYAAGSQWRLLGTYNALDAQRVFRFGHALGRRFVRVPIPAATPLAFEKILRESQSNLDTALRDRVSGLYAAHFSADATLLGPALFIAMCEYLRVGVEARPANIEDGHSNGIDNASETLAEAYVVHIGTWLAQLEPQDIDALRQRSIDNGSLGEIDWKWILSMLGSLA